jgi:hypothetical protein
VHTQLDFLRAIDRKDPECRAGLMGRGLIANAGEDDHGDTLVRVCTVMEYGFTMWSSGLRQVAEITSAVERVCLWTSMVRKGKCSR